MAKIDFTLLNYFLIVIRFNLYSGYPTLHTFINSNDSFKPDLFNEIYHLFDSVRYDLLQLCRESRKMGPAGACEYATAKPFRTFLSIVGSIVGQESGTNSSIESWTEHCLAQKALNDFRSPITCVAASFAHIPFSLSPSNQNFSISTPLHRRSSPESTSLVIVTVDSNHKNSHGPTLRSACKQNLTLHILGVGMKKFYSRGLGAKVELLRKFLTSPANNFDKNALVMFVDGADVIFQSNESVIMSNFLNSGSRILFSGEHACYPMKYFPWNLNIGKWLGPCTGACSNSRYICDKLFPSPNLMSSNKIIDPTNKWLNSGGFIGYIDEVIRMLQDINLIPSDLIPLWPGLDQGIYTNMFLAGKWGIEIDYGSRIFQVKQ
jgi:hypothetical protein